MARATLLDRVNAIRQAKPLELNQSVPQKYREPGLEARREPRKESYKYATLKLNNDMRLDCIVLNYHSTGAKISLKSEFSLPESLIVVVPELGINREARVVWQAGDKAGLHFGKFTG